MKFFKKLTALFTAALATLIALTAVGCSDKVGASKENPLALQENKEYTVEVAKGKSVYCNLTATMVSDSYVLDFADENAKVKFDGAIYTGEAHFQGQSSYAFEITTVDGKKDTFTFTVKENVSQGTVESGDGTSDSPYLLSKIGKISLNVSLIEGLDFTGSTWYKFTVTDGGNYIIYSKTNKSANFSINKTGASAAYTDADTGKNGNAYVASHSEEFQDLGFPYLTCQLLKGTTYYISVSSEKAETLQFVFKKI